MDADLITAITAAGGAGTLAGGAKMLKDWLDYRRTTRREDAKDRADARAAAAEERRKARAARAEERRLARTARAEENRKELELHLAAQERTTQAIVGLGKAIADHELGDVERQGVILQTIAEGLAEMPRRCARLEGAVELEDAPNALHQIGAGGGRG